MLSLESLWQVSLTVRGLITHQPDAQSHRRLLRSRAAERIAPRIERRQSTEVALEWSHAPITSDHALEITRAVSLACERD